MKTIKTYSFYLSKKQAALVEECRHAVAKELGRVPTNEELFEQIVTSAISSLLEEEILKTFDLSPNSTDERAESYETVITDMFEVADVKSNSVRLQHLFNDDFFEPVVFPSNIHKLLHRGDTFLMTIGFNGDHWTAVDMSLPYEQMDIPNKV